MTLKAPSDTNPGDYYHTGATSVSPASPVSPDVTCVTCVTQALYEARSEALYKDQLLRGYLRGSLRGSLQGSLASKLSTGLARSEALYENRSL